MFLVFRKHNRCAEACNTGAIKIAGYYLDSEGLYQKLRRDRDYWGQDGGVTLTGGEPFNQPDFTAEILKKCHSAYIHTCIETCGNVPWKNIEKSLPWLDWIFYDIKHADPEKHKIWTGVDNKQILKNLYKLAQEFRNKIVVRTPIIPGFNDRDSEINAIADIVIKAGLREINILPVHHLGSEKYRLLGANYFDSSYKINSKKRMEEIKKILGKKGLK